jgi:hypothetical protein
MSNAQINRDVAMRYIDELWAKGNLDVADEIISKPPEPTDGNEPGSLGGPEGVKAMVGGVHQLLSGVSREVQSITADEDFVSINSTISGVHSDSWGPIPYPPTGESISISGHAVFKLVDGQIVDEPWSNWNLSGRDQQNAAAIVNRLIASACVRKFIYGAWEGNDPKASEKFLAPNVKITSPWSEQEITGKESVGNWISSFRANNPDFQFESTVHTNHDNGETVFRTWTATNGDEKSSGIAITRFENGLIVEDRMYD